MKVIVADSMQSLRKQGPPCSGVAMAMGAVDTSNRHHSLKPLVMFPEPRLPALSRGCLDLTSESGSLALIAQWVEVYGQCMDIKERSGVKGSNPVGKSGREEWRATVTFLK